MFIFTITTIFINFEVLMPEHMEIFNKIRLEISKNKTGLELSSSVKKYFSEFEKISIDFGIMEYSKNIKVIPVSIGWNDIGSFTALLDIFNPDNFGNVVKNTKVLSYEASNNIIICEDCTVSLLGINNLIVVKNGNNILVSHKDNSQDIKKIVTKYNDFKRENI